MRGLAPRGEPVDPVAHGLGAHGVDHARDLVAPEPERLRLGGGEHPPLGGGELLQRRYVRLLYHASIVYINVNKLSIMISDLGTVFRRGIGSTPSHLSEVGDAVPRSPHPASPRRPHSPILSVFHLVKMAQDLRNSPMGQGLQSSSRGGGEGRDR